jgi:hypothetical protein
VKIMKEFDIKDILVTRSILNHDPIKWGEKPILCLHKFEFEEINKTDIGRSYLRNVSIHIYEKMENQNAIREQE